MCCEAYFGVPGHEDGSRSEGVLERVMFLVDLRRPLCIFPAAKKTRSTPANEAGAARYCLTISWPAQATCSISVLPELEQVSSRSRLRQAMPGILLELVLPAFREYSVSDPAARWGAKCGRTKARGAVSTSL